jgi:hypothetical protein
MHQAQLVQRIIRLSNLTDMKLPEYRYCEYLAVGVSTGNAVVADTTHKMPFCGLVYALPR